MIMELIKLMEVQIGKVPFNKKINAVSGTAFETFVGSLPMVKNSANIKYFLYNAYT